MNKIIISIMGIFVLAGLVYALATFTAAGGDLRVSSLQKGLVGHWALDGESLNNITNRTTDKTPYENHGTNYGATLTTDRMGQGNRAMSFDGVDDYIKAIVSPAPTIFTIEAWIYPTESGREQHFAEFTNTQFYVGSSNKLGTSVWSNVSGATTLTMNTWNHAVCVRDGTEVKLYLNGELDGSGGKLGTNPSTSFYIGALYTLPVSTYYFNGSISDVRIYNRALSADEIDTLYHSYRSKAASGSLQKGLVLDMPLNSKYTKDETVGSEIMTDRTPYSNDGQNYGATVGSDYTSFDGDNDYVNCGKDESLDISSKISISAWYYLPEAIPPLTYPGFVGKGHADGWDLYFYPTYANFIVNVDGARQDFTFGGTSMKIGEWVHLVATYDGTTGICNRYINGGLDRTTTGVSGIIGTPARDLEIGVEAGYYFKGSISDVRIYNHALSAQEIKLLYDKGK